jgi:hypothetical protein
MHVDSPFVGDWMGSAYSALGKRIDYRLFLNPDGTFERVTRQEPNLERVDSGQWCHKDGGDVMQLKSDSPDECDSISSEWWVLTVKDCESSNCLMVLRWAALASRNLPILFYRVHLAGRGF